jgi:hypothetical protein
MIIDKPLRKCELSQSRDPLAVPRCDREVDAPDRVSHSTAAGDQLTW